MFELALIVAACSVALTIGGSSMMFLVFACFADVVIQLIK
jgi:hypothetical protein